MTTAVATHAVGNMDQYKGKIQREIVPEFLLILMGNAFQSCGRCDLGKMKATPVRARRRRLLTP